MEVHLAGNLHWGEKAMASAGVTSGLMTLGQRVTWRAKHLGLWRELTSEITAIDHLFYFEDAMIHGPLQSMRHGHFFQPLPGNEMRITDEFRFAAPLGPLGRLAEFLVLRRYMPFFYMHIMHILLLERNNVIRQVAESDAWRDYLPKESE